MRPAHRFLTFLVRIFFFLLYHPFAWTYDLVAWLVSLGRWKSWVQTILPEISGPQVLELGHGPGHLQQTLREQGYIVYGIDRSKQMGRLASRRLRKVSGAAPPLTRAKAEDLPYRTGAFHDVVATFPSEYILSPATIASIRRVLAPRGKLLILPVAWITGERTLDRAAAWLFRATGQAGEWDSAFSNALTLFGFEVEEKRLKLGTSEVMLLIAKPM